MCIGDIKYLNLGFGDPADKGDEVTDLVALVNIGLKDEFIVSRIYRMLIYGTFLYIEEYIVLNLPYRVS